MEQAPEEIFSRLGWRAFVVPSLLFVVILGLLVLGKLGLVGDYHTWLTGIEGLKGSAWALPAVIAVFCVGAFLGVPQFVLFGAAMVAFGPSFGMGYAWLATLVSGALTYWLGRVSGEQVFQKLAGPRAVKVSAFLGRNGFVASLLVRLVPAGPFVLVNMALGVSSVRFVSFFAGLAVGMLPKLVLVALTARGLIAAGEGATVIALVLGLLLCAISAGASWLVRRFLQKEA